MNIHMLSANIVTAMSQCDEDKLDRMEIVNADCPDVKLTSFFEHDGQIYFRTNQNEVLKEMFQVFDAYNVLIEELLKNQK